MNLTDWFPKNVKPIHVGVYRTDASYTGMKTYQHWNGTFWGMFAPTPAVANRYKDTPSMHSRPRWCGLKEKTE